MRNELYVVINGPHCGEEYAAYTDTIRLNNPTPATPNDTHVTYTLQTLKATGATFRFWMVEGSDTSVEAMIECLIANLIEDNLEKKLQRLTRR